MTRLGRTTAAVLLGVLLAACASGTSQPAPGPIPTPTSSDTSSATPSARLPHFAGRLPVSLQPGHMVFTDPPCTPAPAEHHVCSASGADTYAVYAEPARATLVEARMDLDDQHLWWTVTLRFTGPSGRRLRHEAHLAAQSGAVVLVAREQRDGREGQVLVAVPVPQVSGRTVTLTGLTKPDAWELVQQFVSG